MVDLTFGVVGDGVSYYPIPSDEVRGTVDIMRLGLGTSFNNVFKSPLDAASTFTGEKADKFMKYANNDPYNFDVTGDVSQTYTDYGIKNRTFEFITYTGLETASNEILEEYNVNNSVVADLGDNYVGVNRFSVAWSFDMPAIWSTGRTNETFKRWYSSTISMHNTANNDRIDVKIYNGKALRKTDDSGWQYYRFPPRYNITTYIGGVKSKEFDGGYTVNTDISNYVGLPARDTVATLYTGREYPRTRLNSNGTSFDGDNGSSRMARHVGNAVFNYSPTGSCSLIIRYLNGTYNTLSPTLNASNSTLSMARWDVRNVWNGTLDADISTFKLKPTLNADKTAEQSTAGFRIDQYMEYCRVLYPNLYDTYKVSSAVDYDLRGVKVFDDNNSNVVSNWSRVLSRDHEFVGNIVLDNEFVRVVIGKTANEFHLIQVYRLVIGSTAFGKEVFTVTPVDIGGTKQKRFSGITFKNFGTNQVVASARYGNVIYDITLGRGMPYCNLTSNINKLVIHRSAVSDAVYSGSTKYAENMVVACFTGDYTKVKPDGITADGGEYNRFTNSYRSNNIGSGSGLSYVLSDLDPIEDWFSNYIIWGVNHGTSSSGSYGNVLCFIRKPTSIKRTYSSISGNAGYPSSNYFETEVNFDKPFSVALIDINGDFLKDNTNIKKFVKLTREACQRSYERNFVRRRE